MSLGITRTADSGAEGGGGGGCEQTEAVSSQGPELVAAVVAVVEDVMVLRPRLESCMRTSGLSLHPLPRTFSPRKDGLLEEAAEGEEDPPPPTAKATSASRAESDNCPGVGGCRCNVEVDPEAERLTLGAVGGAR
mmetsp:Transcript_51770/g.112537  ORF Transcript_51770/g.112537 Transcript_51770/m.112537 type:complete len:135 (-) Transcript_51770:20-424(-)